jgi:hypothetical protein
MPLYFLLVLSFVQKKNISTFLLTKISVWSNSTVDKDSREKLEPFSSLSSEESYQSRDLEKVNKS